MNAKEIIISHIERKGVLWSYSNGCKLYYNIFENGETHWSMIGNDCPIQTIINKCSYDHQPHYSKRVRKNWKAYKKNQLKMSENI
jgi:hypothetical protein